MTSVSTTRRVPRALASIATAVVATLSATLVQLTVTSQPAAAASSIDGAITRSEVMDRATNWYSRRYDSDMTYDQGLKTWDGTGSRQYRRDCSGFVDMAWHLGSDPTTSGLMDSDLTVSISRSELLPGDILDDVVRHSDETSDHVILFGGWENTDKTSFWYYSFGGTPLVKQTGASFSDDKFGSHPVADYVPLRYLRIVDDPVVGAPVNDFDKDGKSDIALFRPSAGQWNIKSAARNVQLYGSYPYGGGEDIPLTGDFDADGYTDIALFRKTTGQWNIKSVHRDVQLFASYLYGGGSDIPLTGDFDGDGYTDIALFRPSTGQWNIKSVHRDVQLAASYVYGGGEDIPLAGDFDGDGKDDIALFRKTTGQWNIKSIARNVQLAASYTYGGGEDIPLAGDFDSDGKDDIALFRKTTGQWNIKSIARNVQLFASYVYGGGEDIPLTGDYDGDGYSDIALFRVTTGQWNIKSVHRDVQLLASHTYGGGSDIPATTIPTS